MSTSNNTTKVANMTDYKAGPRKRAPTHPGAVLLSAIEGACVTVAKAAAAMGTSPNKLREIIGGGTVTPDLALRFGRYFGNGPELWLNMQADVDLWTARTALGAKLRKIKPLKKAA